MNDNRSMAEIVSDLSPEKRAEFYADFTEEDMEALEYNADFWLRPNQKVPDGDWNTLAAVAGRGYGKTRLVTEWVRRKARENPGCRIFLAGRTAADVRNTLVTGESGILAVSPPEERPIYKMHTSSLEWPNGSTALLLTAESPDGARGPQAHFAACDEVAAWPTTPDASGATLMDNIALATRLQINGSHPQIVMATTPKRTQFMKDLMKDAKDPANKIKIVTGSTLENRSLPASYVEEMLRKYGNSDLAKQEIEGLMLDDTDGIVFTQEMIDKAQTHGNHPPLEKLWRFIAVDPSVSEDPKTADECGIMVVGITREQDPLLRTAYILEDGSLRATPDVWSDRVVELAKKYRTHHVVAERNQGGGLISMVLKAKSGNLKVHTVWAVHGKKKRVEPIVVAMQQGRVKLAGEYPELVDQLLFFDPDAKGMSSPDRLDSFAWGCTAGLIAQPKTMSFGTFQVQTAANNKVQTNRVVNNLKSGRSRIPMSPR